MTFGGVWGEQPLLTQLWGPPCPPAPPTPLSAAAEGPVPTATILPHWAPQKPLQRAAGFSGSLPCGENPLSSHPKPAVGRGKAEDKPNFFPNIPQSADSCLPLPCQHLKCKLLWVLINATNHPAGEQPCARVVGARGRHRRRSPSPERSRPTVHPFPARLGKVMQREFAHDFRWGRALALPVMNAK